MRNFIFQSASLLPISRSKLESLMFKDRRGYQVIDDDYDESHVRNHTLGSLLPAALTAGRNSLFSAGPENQRLVENAREAYQSRATTAPAALDRMEDQQPLPHMASSSREESNRWNHIADLDRFFSHIYEYHQEGGFMCICAKNVLSLLLFIFVVIFSTFFLQCVDYDVVFANKNTTSSGELITGKRTINDVIIGSCASQLNAAVVICLICATVFWISKCIKATHYLLEMHEIQLFYKTALDITDAELPSHTWNSVLKKLCEVQPHLHLSINCDHLKPIDVYHRILRFKNYFVAMVNQRVLPPVFDVPFMGKVAYLPSGLKYNIKRVLFRGSQSPWQGPCLKDEYRDSENLTRLAREMEKQVSWFACVNLVLMPFIFLYQIAFTFFRIAELVKKSPDALGMRRYSNYGRYQVRHFNELNHELQARLNRSHVYANAYMSQFYSQILKVVATNIRLMAGATAVVLISLSMWDEDVLQIEHVITIIAASGGVVVICNSLIPEETLVYQPEVLLTHVTSELQYLPCDWKGKAHCETVRREFEEIFQLKWMFLLHEITSALFTPFVLYFWMRPRCRDIVRFFHDQSDPVRGTGDVCSFALLDIARHGDPRWNGIAIPQTRPSTMTQSRAMDGKTELSVLHFAALNPDWKPPVATEDFIKKFKARMEQDAVGLTRPHSAGTRNLLIESVHSLVNRPATARDPLLGDGLLHVEGPVDAVDPLSMLPKQSSLVDSLRQSGLDIDAAGASMRLQTLYLRGIHDELRQSMAPSSYGGTSLAPHNSESLFAVPQFMDVGTEESMLNTTGPSRLAFQAPTQTYDERDEDQGNDDDERPDSSFIV